MTAPAGARGIRPPVRVGVDVRTSLSVVGSVVKYLGVAPLFPAAVALGYGEPTHPFLITSAVTFAVGWTTERLTQGHARFGAREGFLIVALTWLAAAAVGALPYLLSGEPQLHHPVDAYFEAMSGFTTTGASVLTDVEALSHSVAMWRQFTQWLGGMGIIVLALAVLPRLRVGGRQLLESELPGPETEPLDARVRDVARRLWVLYGAFTLLLFALLSAFALGGVDPRMTIFDAAAHAFSTMPTGGFSTQARSLEPYAAATQWVIVVFMLVAGANFALMFRAIVRRQPRAVARDEELRLYLGVATLGTLVLATELSSADLFAGEAAIRHAAFQTVSILTSTGFASADFNVWSSVAVMALLGLMFVGGSAGSTGGGVKVVRHLLVGKILRRELDQTLHPELVSPIRMNRVVVPERVLRAIVTFVLLYVGIFLIGATLIAADAVRTGVDLSVVDSVAVAATTLGNIGPAFGVAGPMGSFDPFSDASKTLLIALMWFGRLEIIPVLVLASRHYWRP